MEWLGHVLTESLKELAAEAGGLLPFFFFPLVQEQAIPLGNGSRHSGDSTGRNMALCAL